MMKYLLYLPCSWFLFMPALSTLTVDTRWGSVTGSLVSSSVISYLGLPYAQPPLGPLRFLPPQPLAQSFTYSKTFFNVKAPMCPSAFRRASTRYSEDCLYVDLYRPKNKEGLLPLLVYLGHSSWLDDQKDMEPRVFVEENMELMVAIVETRGLNSLGYLFLTEKMANAGLMDAVMAVQWLMENVEKFGGDPNNITLAGHGDKGLKAVLTLKLLAAGGRPVSKLILSSAGIDRPGIVLSAQEARERSRKLAQLTGCFNDKDININKDDMEMSIVLSCLQSPNVTWEALMERERELYSDPFVPALVLGPVIDGQVLPVQPSQLPWPDKVAMLVGSNEKEGADFVKRALDTLNVATGDNPGLTTDDFDALLQRLLPDLNDITKEVVKHSYTNWSMLALRSSESDALLVDRFLKLVQMVGDRHFDCPLQHLLNTHIKQTEGHIFRYKFSVVNKGRRRRKGATEWMGVTHGDDLDYVWGTPIASNDDLDYDQRDKAMSRFIMRAWTLFAQTGDPMGLEERKLIDWPPYSVEGGLHYLQLDARRHVLVMEEQKTDVGSHCALWSHLVPVLESKECHAVKRVNSKDSNNVKEPILGSGSFKVIPLAPEALFPIPLRPQTPHAHAAEGQVEPKLGERSVNFTLIVDDDQDKEMDETIKDLENDKIEYFSNDVGTTTTPSPTTKEAITDVYDPFYLVDFLKAKNDRQEKNLVQP